MELPKTAAQLDALEMLKDLQGKVEEGLIVSLTVVAERTDGKMMSRSTATENAMAVAGYMLYWANRLVTNAPDEDV